MRMLSSHSYYEIKGRNVKTGRIMKCGMIVSHCVGRYKICNMFICVNFNRLVKRASFLSRLTDYHDFTTYSSILYT